MIDTISLTFSHNDFEILNHKLFTPSSRGLFERPYLEFGHSPFIKCVYNPTSKDLLRYPYLPRLTLIKAVRSGGYSILLKVEFSAPKLLYGNNFDELEEADFPKVVSKLYEILKYLQINIRNIENANISTIHYSKNIILTDFSTPYGTLNEISKVNVTKLLDIDGKDFRNGGHALKYHSNDYEVIFYDKLKDLQKAKISDKRSIERNNSVQLSLFDTYKIKNPFEVFRIEVRLGNRKKISSVMESINRKDIELNFRNLFNNTIAKDILIATMQKIEKDYPKVLKTKARTNQEFMIQLLMDNPKIGFKNLLAIVGARILIAEVGVRNFREVTNKFGQSSWYRINKLMKELVVREGVSPFININNSLVHFEKVRLEDYKEQVL